MRPSALCLVTLCALPGTGFAFEPRLPETAELILSEQEDPGRYGFPIGAARDGEVSIRTIDGSVTRRVWHLRPAQDTLALSLDLKAQLAEAGYVAGFDCKDSDCGGYDFRFAIDTADEPDMYVDLTDYHFISLANAGIASHVALVVSSSPDRSFLQIVQVDRPRVEDEGQTPAPALAPKPTQTSKEPLVVQLERSGRAVLEDLEFATGSATLSNGTVTSLERLADFLKADETRRVYLVGHTDDKGGLEGNLALSRARAEAVRDQLVSGFEVPEGQVAAAGVGFLAPRASNSDDEGRTRNRRVEVVLLTP